MDSRFTPDRVASVAAETLRLCAELDITNADHIALWLETNMDDTSISWLACRIVEAHEAAVTAILRDPPRHKFWGAGEPDCPRDIKAGNGELHTLRCKVCGGEDLSTLCQPESRISSKANSLKTSTISEEESRG